ncbi:uncharacterized protein I303_103009 [Kwoniella dejecticola CBS 10117]|uniref:Uncharacterized protein n=1 Tax=Kwoniella dejecticola CBS 10117 TaxID=1296121 RepID=A0A1A6AAC3_9TREE|nr:uncharacterized protein I303_03028 [Kwoniella dejecticola CBS 10117]OBR87006.1 hypothetical protein I303_03028 [Kwoniella dejecticola CBS 10117]
MILLEHQAQMTFVNPFIGQASNTCPVPAPPPFARISSPRPKLRSCLSPSRSRSVTPQLESAGPTPSGSRSTSFSSTTSESGWKRTKCVRWREMNGCAVTSTHDTYSHEEYDRTPLEPPSTAERECVLPERGSRCLSISRDCFLSDPNSYADEPESLDDEQDTTVDSYFLNTPPPTESCSEDGEADENEEEEKRQWEECMERRRQMFARMCPQSRSNGSPADEDRHPEFEGYKSISATLANLLRSISDNCEAEIEEVDEEEEQGDEQITKDCGFGFTSLNLNGLPVDMVERDVEIDTPSLISTEDESTSEECIASPGGSRNNSTNPVIIPDHTQHQHQHHLGVCTEEMVLAAWTTKKKIPSNPPQPHSQEPIERGRNRVARVTTL